MGKKITLRSGRQVDEETYKRFTSPLSLTPLSDEEVARIRSLEADEAERVLPRISSRKAVLAFTLDMLGLPWSWQAPLARLELTLMRYDFGLYEEFLRENPPTGDPDEHPASRPFRTSGESSTPSRSPDFKGLAKVDNSVKSAPFNLAEEIAGFAQEGHDRTLFDGGQRLWERDELRPRIDECEHWYRFPINDDVLNKHTGITLKSSNKCARNIELKWELHRRFKSAGCEGKQRYTRYYVREWGGIKTNSDETIRRYACYAPDKILKRGVTGIASWSKALVLHDPSCYAIYDARVAVALNYIVARRSGPLARRIEGRRGFPVPRGQNNTIESARRTCKTLWGRFHTWIECQDGKDSGFYCYYLDSIKEAASLLTERGHEGVCMHRIEMMLFGLAESCAQGLFAADRLSEPLSLTPLNSAELTRLASQMRNHAADAADAAAAAMRSGDMVRAREYLDVALRRLRDTESVERAPTIRGTR